MVIIKGYKAATTDIQAIEDILEKMQDRIAKRAERLYAELLANEIETIVDDIAFNVTPRPDIPIYDAAVRTLDEKISYATGHNLHTPYNFAAQVAVFIHKGETYFKLAVENADLCKSIKSIAEISDCCLYDETTSTPQNKERGQLWNEIMSIYSNGRNPLCRQLYPVGSIKPKWEKIAEKFHSREQRVEVRVRRQLTNTLLNMLAMNKEIPPHALLPRLEEAISLLDDPVVLAEGRRMEQKAFPSVVVITEALVHTDPKAAPQTFE